MFQSKFVYLFIIWLYILCNCYGNLKLSNRLYKLQSTAFVFIPFLSQPDTDDSDSRLAVWYLYVV